MSIMSSLKSVGTTISLMADVIALKMLKSMSPVHQAFVGRITGGFITQNACATRAAHNAKMLNETFPSRTIFGVTPSKLIVAMTTTITENAAAQARQLAEKIEDYMDFGKALGELLPARADAYNELDNLIAGAMEKPGNV